MAIFGLFFGFKAIKKAFWLLSLPGFFGIILGLISLGLLITYYAEWPASWPLAAVLIIPPTTAFIAGKTIRRTIKKK